LQWSWRASSLNPHHEGNPGTLMVSDDRFLVKTLDHWDFGPDATGDILAAKTGRHLSSLGPFDLVTADGSIDCQDDPGEQEITVASLLAAETVTALASLKQGGNFVLKTFTWFENSSVSLLYLLCCSFGKVSAVKPVASKEGNSEIYVVCQSFKELSKEAEVLLWTDYGNQFHVNYVPENFLTKIRDASLYFLEFQVNFQTNHF
jgi:cap2 methyltransferase